MASFPSDCPENIGIRPPIASTDLNAKCYVYYYSGCSDDGFANALNFSELKVPVFEKMYLDRANPDQAEMNLDHVPGMRQDCLEQDGPNHNKEGFHCVRFKKNVQPTCNRG